MLAVLVAGAFAAARGSRPVWSAVDPAGNLRSALLESGAQIGTGAQLGLAANLTHRIGGCGHDAVVDWCEELTSVGFDATEAETCVGQEGGEWFCGGVGTCVALLTPHDDTACDPDRLLCYRKVHDQVMAVKSAMDAGVDSDCPSHYAQPLAPLGKPQSSAGSPGCTEYNPSEESRTYWINDGNQAWTNAVSKLDDIGGWSVQGSNDMPSPRSITSNDEMYAVIDLGRVEKVNGVVTQGIQGTKRWVSSFKVDTSVDGHFYLPPQTYQGNVDDSSRSAVGFPMQLPARYVRIRPQTWNGGIALRFGVLVCTPPTPGICSDTVALNPGIGKRTFSSAWQRVPLKAQTFGGDPRLDGAGWRAGAGDPEMGQYTEMDLESVERVVGVRLQACVTDGKADDFVEEFKVAFSLDQKTWTLMDKKMGMFSIETVRRDPNAAQNFMFEKFYAARYLRIYPTMFNGHMCMRAGAVACKESGDGCTGKYWCENLLSAGMQLGEAKMCMVNGDEWYCRNNNLNGYSGTCVAHGSDTDHGSTRPCNVHQLFCSGGNGFGRPRVQARQVVDSQGTTTKMHPDCPSYLRWSVVKNTECWVGAFCHSTATTELVRVAIQSRDDVTMCREACVTDAKCKGFLVNAEKKECILQQDTLCGKKASSEHDCWTVETESPMVGGSANNWLQQRAAGMKAPAPAPFVPTQEPTPPPTASPTAAVTGQPTPKPTPYPTDGPTPKPTPRALTAAERAAYASVSATFREPPPHPVGFSDAGYSQADQEFLESVLGKDPLKDLSTYVTNVRVKGRTKATVIAGQEIQDQEDADSEKQFADRQMRYLEEHLEAEDKMDKVHEEMAKVDAKAWYSEQLSKIKARLADFKNQSRTMKIDSRTNLRNTSEIVKEYARMSKQGVKDAQDEYKVWKGETTKEWEDYRKEQIANFTSALRKMERARAVNNTALEKDLRKDASVIHEGVKELQLPSDEEAFKLEYPMEFVNDTAAGYQY